MCVWGGTTTSQVVCFYFKYFFHFALPFLGSRKRTSGMYLGLVHFLEFSLRIFHGRESNGGVVVSLIYVCSFLSSSNHPRSFDFLFKQQFLKTEPFALIFYLQLQTSFHSVVLCLMTLLEI